MATVTGFTSDRMLVIENETVTTGQVTNDHLILTQRGGTQIDAGNVRGPKGDQGTPGTPGAPGVIQSVNDVSTASVYSPRIFSNKAAIDGWSTAPNGAMALSVDTAIIWQKDTTGWFAVHGVRTFASIAERDSRWLNPPDGSICQAPAGTEYHRIGGVWVYWMNTSAPRGFVATKAGPTALADYTTGSSSVNLPWTPIAGRRYLVSAYAQASQVSAAGNPVQAWLTDSGTNLPNDSNVGGPGSIYYANSLAAGIVILGHTAMQWIAPDSNQHTFQLYVRSGGGAQRVTAFMNYIMVEDIGV